MTEYIRKIRAVFRICGLAVFCILCLWLAGEAILGLRQVFGHASSGHFMFSMTGSFRNPGPYGGFVAILTAVAVSYAVIHRKSLDSLPAMLRTAVSGRRTLRPSFLIWTVFRAIPLLLAITASVLGLIVLPASMSRAAWLSFAAAMLILGFRELGLKDRIKRHGLLAGAACVFALCLMTGAFFMKKDSAVGRFHIWHMELLAMCRNPWHGTGAGTVLGTYGKTQAAYFAAGDRSAAIVRAAGCPEYAFNEYFRIGVEYGVPAMIAAFAFLALAVVLLVRGRSPLGYGLAAFAVFAFFSYPLSLFRRESAAEKAWHDLRHFSSCGAYDDVSGEYERLYGELRGNYRFLYDYGYALHKAGKYTESNVVLGEGADISSDPMFHNIMGKNYEALGKYGAAEHEYMTAHHMVPCRIYPLLLLMEMYMGQERYSDAVEAGKKIQTMPVNPKVRNMTELRQKADRNLAEALRLSGQNF